MKKFLCLVMVFLFSFTFISACGPSEEAIATMTASCLDTYAETNADAYAFAI